MCVSRFVCLPCFLLSPLSCCWLWQCCCCCSNKNMRHWSFFHLIPKAHTHTHIYTQNIYGSSDRLVAVYARRYELCKMPTIQFRMNPQDFPTMLHLVLCVRKLNGTIYAHNRLFLAFALLYTCWSSLLSIPDTLSISPLDFFLRPAAEIHSCRFYVFTINRFKNNVAFYYLLLSACRITCRLFCSRPVCQAFFFRLFSFSCVFMQITKSEFIAALFRAREIFCAFLYTTET